MLEMRAIVIRVQDDQALVQPMGTGGCGHCSSAGGCGSGKLSQMFCSSKPRHFTVRNQACAGVGDEVQVSLPDGMLLRGATKMYLLPLVLMLGGSLLGVNLASEASLRDAYAVAGAVIGLSLGFILARLSLLRVGQAVATSIVTPYSIP